MEKRIYFFLHPQGPPEDASYQHCAVALGEGLRALGIAFSSNIDYWPGTEGPLFRRDTDVRPEECAVIVVNDEYDRTGRIPEHLFGGGRQTIYIDSSDGWRTRAEGRYYRQFDLVLRTHLNGHYHYPQNIHPWAFGLTERIISACEAPNSYEARERRILSTFRVTHPVRDAASRIMLKYLSGRFSIDRELDSPPAAGSGEDRALWEATGRRHYPGYFARLRKRMLCAAFGGYFAPGVFRSTENLPERVLYSLGWRLGVRTGTIMQFDSWRFWESLAAGCLTLQVEYARYGCLLPEMPSNGEHYAGFDLGERHRAPWVRDADEKELARVAAAGRMWALEQYSPRAAARRMLGLLGQSL
jgi:hypothetical protein